MSCRSELRRHDDLSPLPQLLLVLPLPLAPCLHAVPQPRFLRFPPPCESRSAGQVKPLYGTVDPRKSRSPLPPHTPRTLPARALQ